MHPQAPPPTEAARGSRDPAPRTLPRPIRPGEQVTPPVGSTAKTALEERARQLRGQKRSADVPPDDPRTTNTDMSEVEPPNDRRDRLNLNRMTPALPQEEMSQRLRLTCQSPTVSLHRTDPRALLTTSAGSVERDSIREMLFTVTSTNPDIMSSTMMNSLSSTAASKTVRRPGGAIEINEHFEPARSGRR